MPDEKPEETSNRKAPGWLGTFRAMPNDSTQKTLIVAFVLCLACSVVVSSAAVLLKPLQEYNEALDRQKNILAVVGLLEEGKSIDELFEPVEPKVVDLASGKFVDTIDPATFDQHEAARDPARSVAIPRKRDVAAIGTRAKYATVYLVKDGDTINYVILPVHGAGLFATMYGFLALESDGNTVVGLRFYQHAETPGLGGEIDNPRWFSQWQGKVVFDDTGAPRIEVIRGTVASDSPEAKHQVDGLAGATLTSNGVTNLLRFWLSEDGFAPFLAKIRTQTG